MLDLILQRADLRDGSTFSADEVAQWPPGVLDRLLTTGLVREITPTNAVTCDQCEDACWIEPMVRDNPRTGKPIGMYFCRTHKDVGRFEVSLERLRRWEVHVAGLAAAVARALSISGSAEDIVTGRLYRLGRMVLAGKSREVFLGLGLACSDAANVVAQAKCLRTAQAPIVLVPARVPAEGLWNRHVPTVRALTEVATFNIDGDLTIVAVHLDEEEDAHDRKGKQREAVRGWKAICEFLEWPPKEWRALKRLNKTQNGTIRSLGTGKPPEVWSDELAKWWEDQDSRIRAGQEKEEPTNAALGSDFQYGRKGEIVIPETSMHVRKRRKGQGKPRNDNH